MWPIKNAKNHIVLSYELKNEVGPSLQDDPLDIVMEISDSERDSDIQMLLQEIKRSYHTSEQS
jgi:hypothetical protein